MTVEILFVNVVITFNVHRSCWIIAPKEEIYRAIFMRDTRGNIISKSSGRTSDDERSDLSDVCGSLSIPNAL